MVEHATHQRRELIERFIGVNLSIVEFFLHVAEVALEFIDFLETAGNHAFLGLVGVHSHGIDSENSGDFVCLVLREILLFAGLLRLLLQVLGQTLLAERPLEEVQNGLWEVLLAEVPLNHLLLHGHTEGHVGLRLGELLFFLFRLLLLLRLLLGFLSFFSLLFVLGGRHELPHLGLLHERHWRRHIRRNELAL